MTPHAPSADRLVLFLGGASGRDNSQLALILANRPEGFACGQAGLLFDPQAPAHLAPRCACADPTCRIWQRLKGTPEESFFPALFDQQPGLRYIVDSTGDPLWIARARRQLAAAGIASAVILPWQAPAPEGAAPWLTHHRQLLQEPGAEAPAQDVLAQDILAQDILALPAADLARPDRLAALAARLGLPWSEGQTRYWQKTHHMLFGDPAIRGRLNPVEAALAGAQAPEGPETAAPAAPPEDPRIGQILALLTARDIAAPAGAAPALPAALALSPAEHQALARQHRARRRALWPARLRRALRLPPVPGPRPDRAKRQLAFVLPGHVSAQAGGAEYQANLILQELARAPGAEGRQASYLCREGDLGFAHPAYRLSVLPKVPVLARYAYFVDLPLLLARLKALKPAVIYNRDAGAYTWACARAARACGAKLVLHLAHDKDVTPMQKPYPRNFLKRIDKALLEKGLVQADHIIAQTPLQAELLERHYGRKVDLVLPNAQPVPDLPDPGLRADPPLVLWVANFKAFKQPELFLELARRLEGTGAQFVMVGQAKDDYAELLRQIAAQPNITHLGALPQGAVLDLMARAAIFVNTSTAEGFPNTFLQAWMRAVPVVSLNADPGDALIKGMGYRSGSLEAMERDIARLLDDPALRAEIGTRARAYSSEKFGLAALAPLLDLLT